MLKDDKSYPFIKVTVQEAYPRVLFARRMKKDKNRYFGPYTSGGAVKDVIELVRKLYRCVPVIETFRETVERTVHACIIT